MKKQRETLLAALWCNITETGLTLWYGSIGVALESKDTPLIGQLTPWMVFICCLIPVLSRWKQAYDIANTHEAVAANLTYLYGMATAKAVVNLIMTGAAVFTTRTMSVDAASTLIISWCISKIITLGDKSPIHYFEGFFSIPEGAGGAAGARAAAAAAEGAAAQPGEGPERPEDMQRLGFWSSLGSNVASTGKATFYGVVTMSATVGEVPFVGQIHPAVAGVLFVVPLLVRMNQIQIMLWALRDPDNASYFRSLALVNTVVDLSMGVLIYGVTSYSADPKITGAVLLGWIGAKLSSGGSKSHLEHMTGFFMRVFGSDANFKVD